MGELVGNIHCEGTQSAGVGERLYDPALTKNCRIRHGVERRPGMAEMEGQQHLFSYYSVLNDSVVSFQEPAGPLLAPPGSLLTTQFGVSHPITGWVRNRTHGRNGQPSLFQSAGLPIKDGCLHYNLIDEPPLGSANLSRWPRLGTSTTTRLSRRGSGSSRLTPANKQSAIERPK
jgi:hypothetical protein